jgi:hypothetical protein
VIRSTPSEHWDMLASEAGCDGAGVFSRQKLVSTWDSIMRLDSLGCVPGGVGLADGTAAPAPVMSHAVAPPARARVKTMSGIASRRNDVTVRPLGSTRAVHPFLTVPDAAHRVKRGRPAYRASCRTRQTPGRKPGPSHTESRLIPLSPPD